MVAPTSTPSCSHASAIVVTFIEWVWAQALTYVGVCQIEPASFRLTLNLYTSSLSAKIRHTQAHWSENLIDQFLVYGHY